MSFRVGIVGCGSIAHTHARVLDQLEKTHLAACADIRPERAQAFSDRYGCRPYNSIHALLENEALDAVHLCVPHYLHAPMAALAAEHGVAVMCEKPPVTQRAQWPLLEAAAEKVPLAFCFQNRYNENVRALREILASGRYGAVRGARAFLTWDRQAPYYTESGWRGAWETEGGGVLINQCVHTLDLLVTLLGKPETVEAHMTNHHLRGVIEVEDTLEAYMTCGGCPVLLYATTAYAANAPVMIGIEFEDAAVRLEKTALEIRTPAGIERRDYPDAACLGKDYWGSGHLKCISDFYESIEAGLPLRNGLDSVRDTVDVMLKMYEQNKGL